MDAARAVDQLNTYIWIPVGLIGGDLSAVHHVAVGIGAAGPSLAGVACAAMDEGRRGVRSLFASLMSWRLGVRWYVLCLGGPVAVALTAVALHRLAVGDDAQFRLETATVLLIPASLVVGLLIGPLQEELGWRGYALPSLLDRWSSVPAALVLALPGPAGTFPCTPWTPEARPGPRSPSS